jgi:hypothetical protein
MEVDLPRDRGVAHIFKTLSCDLVWTKLLTHLDENHDETATNILCRTSSNRPTF